MFAKRSIQTTANIVQLAPSKLLSGRKALITGGTSGIGYSIAQAYLNAGAEVVITGRSKNRIDDAINSLKQYGRVSGMVLDNKDVKSIESIFTNIVGGGN